MVTREEFVEIHRKTIEGTFKLVDDFMTTYDPIKDLMESDQLSVLTLEECISFMKVGTALKILGNHLTTTLKALENLDARINPKKSKEETE